MAAFNKPDEMDDFFPGSSCLDQQQAFSLPFPQRCPQTNATGSRTFTTPLPSPFLSRFRTGFSQSPFSRPFDNLPALSPFSEFSAFSPSAPSTLPPARGGTAQSPPATFPSAFAGPPTFTYFTQASAPQPQPPPPPQRSPFYFTSHNNFSAASPPPSDSAYQSTVATTNHNLQGSARHNPPSPPQREPNSDDYLEALARGNFSSPLLPSASPQQYQQAHDWANFDSSYNHTPVSNPSTRCPIAPWHTNERDFVDRTVGDFEEEEVEAEETPASESQLPNMPPTAGSRKRSRASTRDETSASTSSTSKRRRVAAVPAPVRTGTRTSPRSQVQKLSHPAVVAKKEESVDDDSLFGDNDAVDMIDLSKEEDVPKELIHPKEDKSIKLTSFECIICMDQATDLTITYCGHMFCGACLHQAMTSEVTKKICPMCRQKLEARPPQPRTPSKTAKTYFHLELKLMPANRRGKRPAKS